LLPGFDTLGDCLMLIDSFMIFLVGELLYDAAEVWIAVAKLVELVF
jgi:hypothetical protein